MSKRFFSVYLFAYLFCIGGASAFWQSRDSTYNTSAAVTYQGPGDVVSGWKVWYGLRCYSAAYSGSVADVYAPLDASHTLLTCSSGTINETLQALATTCAVSCTIKTLYDQSGATQCSSAACNATQATSGLRPAYITNCTPNNKPCMQFTGSSSQILTSGNATDLAQPNTVSTVMERNAAFTTLGAYFADSSGNITLRLSNTTGQIYSFCGNLTSGVTMANSAFHAVQALLNGTSNSAIQVDNTNTTGLNCGTNGFHFAYMIGEDNYGQYATMYLSEVGVINSDNTSYNSAMYTNQKNYWGF